MPLNFLGLGFSFGAKDTGLGKQLEGITGKLDQIVNAMAGVAAGATKATQPLEGMVSPKEAANVQGLASSVEGLGTQVGDNLVDQSKRGAQGFDKASRGIERGEDRIEGGFLGIKDIIEKLNSILSINRLATFIESISLSRLNDIAEKLGDVGATGGQLTTSFEATIVASNKSARAMGANFGMSGKALSKFTSQSTSMGIALNISADEAAKATYAYAQATKYLGAMGIKSAAELAKFTAVTGVSGDMLSDVARQMGTQFKMTDEQIKAVTSSFTQAGQAMGNVGGTLQDMPKMMEQIQRRAVTMGGALDPDELAKYAQSTAALAAGFYKMGNSEEKAREMALGMSDTMIKARENFSGLFAGTEQELGPFVEGLGIATGDVQNAFQAMKQGPDEFMSGMAQMVLQSKKAGKFNAAQFNLMQGQLQKVFGDSTPAVMQFLTTADDATLEMMGTIKKADKSLGKLADEGFSTGRTLEDSFGLMKDQFIMSFRDIGRSSAEDFVKKTGEQFKIFNDQMKGIVSKGGPLAAVVTKFSEIHQIGAMALLPQTLRPLAAVFGTMAKELGPVLGVLGSLGFRLNMLASPATIILAAFALLAGWFVKLRLEGKSTGDAFKIMAVKITETAQKLWLVAKKWVGKLFEYLASVDWVGVFSKIFDALVFVWKTAGSLLRKIPWAKIFKGALKVVGNILEWVASEGFRKALVNVFDFLGGLINDLASILVDGFKMTFDWLSNLAIGDVLKGLVKTLSEGIKSIGRSVAGLIGKVMDIFAFTASEEFRQKFAKIVSGVEEGIKSLVNSVADLLESAIDWVLSIDLGKVTENILDTLTTLYEGYANAILGMWEAIFQRLPGLLKKAVDLVIKFFTEIPPAIGRWLGRAGDVAKRLLYRATTAILDGIWGLLQAIPGMFWKVIKAIPNIIAGIGSMIKGAVDFVVKAILGIFQALEDWLVKKFPGSAETIKKVFFYLKVTIMTIGDVIKTVIDIVVAVFKFLWKIVEPILSALWEIVKWVAGAIWDFVKVVIDGVSLIIDAISWVVDKISSAVSAIGDFFSWIGDTISSIFGGGSEDLSATINEMTKEMDRAANKGAKTADELARDMARSSNAATRAIGEATLKALEDQRAQQEANAKVDAQLTKLAAGRAKEEAAHQEKLKQLTPVFTEIEVGAGTAYDSAQKAGDAVAKNLEKNVILVDKTVRVANKLAFPKLAAGMDDIAESYRKVNEEFRAAKTEQEINKVVKAMDDLRTKTQEQYGVTASFFEFLQEDQRKNFSMAADFQKKASVNEMKAYQGSLDMIYQKYAKERLELEATNQMKYKQKESERGQIQGQINQIVLLAKASRRELTDAELAAINTLKSQSNIIQEQYVADVKKLAEQDAANRNRATLKALAMDKAVTQTTEEMYASLTSKEVAGAYYTAEQKILARKKEFDDAMVKAGKDVAKRKELEEGLAKDMIRLNAEVAGSQEQVTVYISALNKKMVGEMDKLTANIADGVKSQAEDAKKAVSESYTAQLEQVLATTEQGTEAQKLALASLDKWRSDKMTEYATLVTNLEAGLERNNGQVTEAMSNNVSNFVEGVKVKGDEAAKAMEGTVGSMQRELGVSSEEALRSMEAISKIDPVQFEKNLREIKRVYLDFSKTAIEQTKAMMTETGKAMAEFNTASVAFWSSQKAMVLTLFVFKREDGARIVSSLAGLVTAGLVEVTDAIVELFLQAMVKSFVKGSKEVVKAATIFGRDLSKVFQTLATNIEAAFKRSFGNVAASLSSIAAQVTKDVRDMTAKLGQATSVLKATQATRAAQDVTGELPEVSYQLQSITDPTELQQRLIQATDNPAWWLEYQSMFLAQTQAILNLGASPRGGRK